VPKVPPLSDTCSPSSAALLAKPLQLSSTHTPKWYPSQSFSTRPSLSVELFISLDLIVPQTVPVTKTSTTSMENFGPSSASFMAGFLFISSQFGSIK
jgi:hypothetical protein